MADSNYTLELVRTALDELDHPDSSLSGVTRKALRIARLRNDWEAVYWLQTELEGYNDKNAIHRRMGECAPYFSKERFEQINNETMEAFISSRSIATVDTHGKINKDKMLSLGIQEIEAIILNLLINTDPLPANLHPYDAAVFSDRRQKSHDVINFMVIEMRKVTARISQRVHSYLSQVERQLFLGQLQSDIFEDNRSYVNEKLETFAPDVLEQIQIAYRRTREGTAEARSHALTSCRRALKSLADRLYPPRDAPIIGADGKERILNDQMYISRLWQFITETKVGNTSKNLLSGELDQLGKNIDRLYDLACKGVHDEVSEFEVNLCVTTMYNVISALLRLYDETSGALLNASDLTTTQ